MGRKKAERVPEPPCLYGGQHVQYFGGSLESTAEILGVSTSVVAGLVMQGALKSYFRNGERVVYLAYDDFAGNTGYGDYCRCVLKLLE